MPLPLIALGHDSSFLQQRPTRRVGDSQVPHGSCSSRWGGKGPSLGPPMRSCGYWTKGAVDDTSNRRNASSPGVGRVLNTNHFCVKANKKVVNKDYALPDSKMVDGLRKSSTQFTTYTYQYINVLVLSFCEFIKNFLKSAHKHDILKNKNDIDIYIYMLPTLDHSRQAWPSWKMFEPVLFLCYRWSKCPDS